MKRYFAVLLLVLLYGVHSAAAAGADDQYVQIFNLIQEADDMGSQPEQALAKYREAQNALLKFQKENPNWSPSIVSFRLEYVTGKIQALAGKAPSPASATPSSAATNATPPTSGTPAVAAPTTPTPAPPAASENLEAQLNGLKDQVRQLQGEKSLLEAKLKEAFSAQPAQTDPRELERAERALKDLQKENDLLKATIDSQKGKVSAPSTVAAEAQTQRSLADANQQLTAQKELVAKLTLENEALKSQARTAAAPPAATLNNPPAAAAETARLKQVEHERDTLRKELESAQKALASRKGKNGSNRTQELENELLAAQARLDVLQARAVPYSPEELALMNKPSATLSEAQAPGATPQKATTELSPEARDLVVQAQRFLREGQLGQAENSYTRALKKDPANVGLLGDLASIQLEANHIQDSDSTVHKALTLSPDNAYALSVLGRVRFQQGRYDEAIDALSRAAKIEPKNAEVQNFLGLALSEKGLRGPAEAALRKAVELDPNYASAHHNLAVVYLTGKPPSVELARWHYQRALAAGEPHNAQLEKMLEAAK